jgi:hypothetical protein
VGPIDPRELLTQDFHMSQPYRLAPIALTLGDKAERPPERIQVVRVGTFHSLKYGKFEITKEDLLSFKKNFDAGVRGVDIALDYKHASEDIAAAWFKSLELSADGTELWATPTWTPNGAKVVLDKEFRYVSADFTFDYQDNETLKKYGPTLLGAGLTNRPVIKGQTPVIELTEGKGDVMDPKDKEIADLKAQLAALQKQLDDLKAKEAGEPDASKDLQAAQAKVKEQAAQLAEFAKKEKDAAEAKVLSEKKSEFDKKLSEGIVVEAQREPFMSNDMMKFMSLAQPVQLGAKGKTTTTSTTEKTAEDEVIALAEQAIVDKKAKDIGSAISFVLSEKPELRKRYENAQ